MAAPAFTLFSKLKTEYVIFTHLAKQPAKAPVLLVMDGDDQFDTALEALDALVATGEVHPINLIGVGYGGGYRSPKNRRARDYTPSKGSDEPMETGGAAAFHDFLESELLPELKRRYAVEHPDVGIGGHSLGSLFGLYAWCRAKPTFTRFLLSSPSIWWDDRAVLADYRRTASTDPGQKVKVFLSIGDDDTPSMTGDFALLEQLHQQTPRPQSVVAIQHFPQRDHYDVLPDAFREGIKALYGP